MDVVPAVQRLIKSGALGLCGMVLVAASIVRPPGPDSVPECGATEQVASIDLVYAAGGPTGDSRTPDQIVQRYLAESRAGRAEQLPGPPPTMRNVVSSDVLARFALIESTGRVQAVITLANDPSQGWRIAGIDECS